MFVKILSVLILSLNLQAADTQALSTKVIELRKEVELLNDEYKTEREKVLSEIKTLSLQKAELSSNVRNEEIRRKQLLEKLTKLKKEIGNSSIESKALEPVIFENIESLRNWVETSLPFKQKERLESIHTLKTRVEKNEVSPVKAANELFALLEDEKRLAKETSLHRQSIPVEGKMHLAEVVKVGMLFLYFKTENNKVGVAQKMNDQWVYLPFKNESSQKKTLAFFESLKKQIRQGYFELPTTIEGA